MREGWAHKLELGRNFRRTCSKSWNWKTKWMVSRMLGNWDNPHGLQKWGHQMQLGAILKIVWEKVLLTQTDLIFPLHWEVSMKLDLSLVFRKCIFSGTKKKTSNKLRFQQSQIGRIDSHCIQCPGESTLGEKPRKCLQPFSNIEIWKLCNYATKLARNFI